MASGASDATSGRARLLRLLFGTGSIAARLAGAATALAIVWAFLQVAWFLRSNIALWSGGAGARLGVFSGLLSTDWSFSLRHCPPLTLFAALFVAAMTTWLGVRAQHAIGLRLPWRVAPLLGFPLGLGISGVAFELLTMARLLYWAPAWIVWIALIGACEWLSRRRPMPEVHPHFRTDSYRLKPASHDLPEDRVFWWLGAFLAAAMTLAIFWNALFFPETYWDSLILYLGYARMTFLEHAFPFKAVGQVGIGLGANYPHLFSTYGAAASTLFGEWSDLHQRLAAPIAGLCAMLLVYEAARLVSRRRAVAMAAALLFRLVPESIVYSTYASDYAVAVLLAAAMLFAAVVFVRACDIPTFAIITAIPAMAMHVNYLMGILWLPWAVAVAFALLRKPWEFHWNRRVFAVLAICAAAGSTWYIRNWILTGNPVYAFFPKLFPASVRINPAVMRSADIEWFRNGDGIGRVAEQLADFRAGRQPFRDHNAPGFTREARLRDRVAASWLYWQGFETFRFEEGAEVPSRGRLADRFAFLAMLHQPIRDEPGATTPTRFFWTDGTEVRLLHYRHAYKLQPLLLGFSISGALLLLASALRPQPVPSWWQRPWQFLRFYVLADIAIPASLAVGFLAFHYLLADYYLYQIVPIVVPLAFLSMGLFAYLDGPRYVARARRIILFALFIVAALVPGLAMSLMNFKVPGGGTAFGQAYSTARLDIFRHPGLDAAIFQRLCYGDDVDAWDYVNEHCKGASILTHENRHLMFDPSIELVHLDDWDVQQTYAMTSPQERLAFLRQRGIRYYLRVPNEAKHEINARAGVDELIARGNLVLRARFGPNELYEFPP